MNKKLTKEEFIKRARKVHGDKYDYSNVEYINNNTKVCIICPEHGEFWQTPHAHLRSEKCPVCYGTKKLTKEEFIKRAREVHGDKYDYSKVEYVNANTKVCIICPEHGEFWQTPASHLRGRKCNKCSRPSYDTESFVKCAREVHGDKYDYSKVEYVNTKTKVCIICPKHGEFWQTPNEHLQGYGCHLCFKKEEEKLFLELCNEFGIENVITQKTFDWLINPETNYHQYLDFYLPDYNVGIEYQGIQHYKPNVKWDKNKDCFSKRQILDKNKKELCEKNNVKLLYFTFHQEYEKYFPKNEKIYTELLTLKQKIYERIH